jgi:hypothetical protein
MECALKSIHHHQYTPGDYHIWEPQDESRDDDRDNRRCSGATITQIPSFLKKLLKESFSELRVSEGQSPKTEVRSSVRNATENEFNGLNHLMDEVVTESVFSVCIGAAVHFLVKKLLISFHVFSCFIFRSSIDCLCLIIVGITWTGINALEFVVWTVFLFAATTQNTRLNAKHSRHSNENQGKKELCNAFLWSDPIDILFAELHEVCDHRRDNSGAVSQR